jgi:hypothetical protein
MQLRTFHKNGTVKRGKRWKNIAAAPQTEAAKVKRVRTNEPRAYCCIMMAKPLSQNNDNNNSTNATKWKGIIEFDAIKDDLS